MAAGIIHEINDRLNFLMNILPELKKDLEGLTKAYSLIRTGEKNEASEKVKRIAEQSGIDEHIEELDYVFNRAENAVRKSTRLANSMKVFTQRSAPDTMVESDLLDIAREAIELIPEKFRRNVEIDVIEESAVRWKVNPDRMGQVFTNLITNAVDAMGGKGKITVRAHTTANGAEVSVEDTGPGIPDSIKKQIFNPFFTTKPPGKSTGLGLTICVEILSQFGGVFDVSSREGKGSRFRMIFRKDLLQQAKQKKNERSV
jgi:signal transduction histidine kinase